MESSISSSFAHTAITGHDPRGLSNAMSQVILPEASTAVVPLTSALSQSAGYGHISNSVSAVSRTFEEGAEHVDPKAPLAKVTIGSFLQGSGLARGAGTVFKDDTNAVLAINLVNGTSAYPSHHNPYAFLSSVTDAELKQDNTFEAMSDAYLNGMGQASGFGGDDSKGIVYTNAQGYGLANGYAKLKFDRQDPQQVVEAHTTRGTKAAGFSQGESLKDKCSENGMDVECDTDGADEGFENLVDMVVAFTDLFKGFKTDPQVHLGRKLLQSQVGGTTKTKAAGPGGFAVSSNKQCEENGCPADGNVKSTKSSHSAASVGGPYARGASGGMASTDVSANDEGRTAVRSDVKGTGIIANFADASYSTGLSDVPKPKSQSYSVVQGDGQATGVAASYVASDTAYVALGGVMGVSGFPNLIQPSASLVADVTTEKDTDGGKPTTITADAYFSGVGPYNKIDQSFGLGYVGAVPAFSITNNPQALVNAGGIGVSNGRAFYTPSSQTTKAVSSRGAASYALSTGADEACSRNNNMGVACGDVKAPSIPGYIESNPFEALSHYSTWP
ncbi:hypothetical protein HOP50_13g70450 [Chloropicon primus]|uniref:Uncharacterized protein n=2 Tax=Chloropicon primus TaxID=1764295 RepID=A0A5B8MWF2_9CHLO|nr:hypothetical protein A3770_13p70240 [Chloropicon primus]UPR03715.1 hypothetical protein HOP50_13g70450 [Chloropicon primus]|eukprot:QDZ24506.1 hypothetical protein A3770_13p70240 [Chloropicon primus]